MGFEWVLIDYIGGTYMSINISKDFPQFNTFPGPVDLHFGPEIDQNRLKIAILHKNVRLKVIDWDLNGFYSIILVEHTCLQTFLSIFTHLVLSRDM